MILFIGDKQSGYFVDEVAASFGQDVMYTGLVEELDDLLIQSLRKKAKYIIINIGDLIFYVDEIVKIVSRIKQTAAASTIIVMAQGYSMEASLIASCVEIGIEHFLLSPILGCITQELEGILSGKSTPVRLSTPAPVQPIVETPTFHRPKMEEPSPVFSSKKKMQTIAIAGCIHRIGTTTQCLQILRYLQSKGKKVCYIEFNNTGWLTAAKQYLGGVVNQNGYVSYLNLDLYAKDQIESVLRETDYDFCVYDYGVTTELDHSVKASFLEKSKKIIICGISPTELSAMKNVIDSFYQSDVDYIFSFVANTDEKDTLECMGDRADRVHFADYTPDPFFFSGDSIAQYDSLFGWAESTPTSKDKDEKKKGLFHRKRRKE